MAKLSLLATTSAPPQIEPPLQIHPSRSNLPSPLRLPSPPLMFPPSSDQSASSLDPPSLDPFSLRISLLSSDVPSQIYLPSSDPFSLLRPKLFSSDLSSPPQVHSPSLKSPSLPPSELPSSLRFTFFRSALISATTSHAPVAYRFPS